VRGVRKPSWNAAGRREEIFIRKSPFDAAGREEIFIRKPAFDAEGSEEIFIRNPSFDAAGSEEIFGSLVAAASTSTEHHNFEGHHQEGYQ
jgi:hypothetical protein